MIVHLIKKSDRKIRTFQYSRQDSFENVLRGHSADLIILDNAMPQALSSEFFKLLNSVVIATNGKILILS